MQRKYAEAELLRPYIGEWVIIDREKIVAHHKSLVAIKDKIATCKGTPRIMYVPAGEMHLF